jgi:hypothetical protein
MVFNRAGTVLVVEEVEAVGPVKSNGSYGYTFDIHMKSGNTFVSRTDPGTGCVERINTMRDTLIKILNGGGDPS